MPPERVISFLRVRACGGCCVAPGVRWAARVCRLLSLTLAGLAPCGAVFFGVRFGGRGIPGNVLLSEIYILACSEPPLQQLVNTIRVGKNALLSSDS